MNKKKIFTIVLTLIIAYLLSFIPILLGAVLIGLLNAFGLAQTGVGITSGSSTNIFTVSISFPTFIMETLIILIHFYVSYKIAVYFSFWIKKQTIS